jgi:hypothetical protein
MAKADNILVARIHYFKDGDYEYTGQVFTLNPGPDGWILNDADYTLVLQQVQKKWGTDVEGFEVFGLNTYIHKSVI